MAREKTKRDINFKPIYKTFIPKDKTINGNTTLLHEEIEAIHLMDVLGYYQEESAKSMGISRPTFTRILKSARTKLANALINGHQIDIQDDKKDYIIAVLSDQKEKFINMSPLSKYILLYQIVNNNFILLDTLENPAYKKEQKPAVVLPKILLQKKVNFLITSKIGEGVKNSLISKGLNIILKNSLDFEELKNIDQII